MSEIRDWIGFLFLVTRLIDDDLISDFPIG